MQLFTSQSDYNTFVNGLPKITNVNSLAQWLQSNDLRIAGTLFIRQSAAISKTKRMFIANNANFNFAPGVKWQINGDIYLDDGAIVPEAFVLRPDANVYTSLNYIAAQSLTVALANKQNSTFATGDFGLNSIERGILNQFRDLPISVKNFNVVADWNGSTGTSIATGLANALAVNNNVIFPPGNYYVSGNATINLTKDTIIDFGVSRLFFEGTASLRINNTVVASPTLSGDITKDAVSCSVSSATGISAGSLLFFVENTIAESSFSSKRNAVVQVRSVSGTTVYFSEPIGMPFANGCPISVYNPRRLVLKTPSVFRVGATAGQNSTGYTGLLQLVGWLGLTIVGATISSDQVYSASGSQDGNGILVATCIGAEITDTIMSNVSYGISLPCCRNTLISGIDAQNVRHPVVPSTWSRNTRIEHLRSRDCYSTVDSHAAFETHYRDVRGLSDSGLSNLRCVGGSLVDVDVTTSADTNVPGPYFNFLVLTAGHTDFYDNTYIDFERVRLLGPNRIATPIIGANFGNVRVRDVVASIGDSTYSAFASTLQSIEINNGRNPDRSPWHTNAIRLRPAPTNTQLLDAYLDSSVYHIDPRKYPVPISSRVLKCSGLLVAGIATDATALTIRVHTNCWPGTPIPSRVMGEIRFKMHVTHNNAGNWSNQIKQFGFYHRIIATSAIIMPTTPDFVSSLTGVANESASMTLSSPTQQGVSELGSGQFDYYIEFILTLTSGGRTSPIMDVWYDLDLFLRTS